MWNKHTSICTYRVKNGARGDFIKLLSKHWPILNKNKLVTNTPATLFEATPERKNCHGETETTFIEIFSWSSADASSLAHQIPEVMAIWEPMGGLVEDRNGRPGMEFPNFCPLNLNE